MLNFYIQAHNYAYKRAYLNCEILGSHGDDSREDGCLLGVSEEFSASIISRMRYSETSESIYQITRCNFPESSCLLIRMGLWSYETNFNLACLALTVKTPVRAVQWGSSNRARGYVLVFWARTVVGFYLTASQPAAVAPEERRLIALCAPTSLDNWDHVTAGPITWLLSITASRCNVRYAGRSLITFISHLLYARRRSLGL